MEIKEQVRSDDPVTGTTVVRETTGRVVDVGQAAGRASNKINQVIGFIVGLIDVLLAIRIVFGLLGAHAVGFASSVYSFTYPLAAPFAGIFPAPSSAGSYFDSAAILAIVVYSLIGWGLTALVDVLGKPAAPVE
jgi:hypothetical protein